MFDALTPNLEVGRLLSITLQTSFSYNSVESRSADTPTPPVTMRIYNIDNVLIYNTRTSGAIAPSF